LRPQQPVPLEPQHPSPSRIAFGGRTRAAGRRRSTDDVTEDVAVVNTTPPTSRVGRNVRSVEFTGLTHQQRVG
ncbi:MAG: hypothetical protein ACRDTT_05410, partial [Pseudonocardiaceae bacterium]